MGMSSREHDRESLRRLDSCLNQLEDAHERDQTEVSEFVAARVRAYVPAVRAGMPIPEAINLVLREQQQHLIGDPEDAIDPLDEADARALTEQIKHATRQVCMLLYEAHRGRAWLALGYATWDQYVQSELGLSRTRSYELLDQGKVLRAVMAAAGISGIPDISAYAAGQIKPYLPELIETVRERAAGLPEQLALVVVVQVVRERRMLIAQERRRVEAFPLAVEPYSVGLLRLQEAIARLTDMPPVDDVIARVDEREADRLVGLDQAVSWLTQFAEKWQTRRGMEPPPHHILLQSARNGSS
jgi:hypothetical protein